MVKKRQRRKHREKLFIIMTHFFVLQQPYFQISSSQVAACLLMGVFPKRNLPNQVGKFDSIESHFFKKF